MNNLLRGKYIKEIAGELSLSISSVSTYKVRVLNKLKLNNILELSMLAKEYNLVIPKMKNYNLIVYIPALKLPWIFWMAFSQKGLGVK